MATKITYGHVEKNGDLISTGFMHQILNVEKYKSSDEQQHMTFYRVNINLWKTKSKYRGSVKN